MNGTASDNSFFYYCACLDDDHDRDCVNRKGPEDDAQWDAQEEALAEYWQRRAPELFRKVAAMLPVPPKYHWRSVAGWVRGLELMQGKSEAEIEGLVKWVEGLERIESESEKQADFISLAVYLNKEAAAGDEAIAWTRSKIDAAHDEALLLEKQRA